MAITFVAAGSVIWGASGNVTPGLPAGWAADDIHICVINSSDNIVPTMPAGWTSKQGLNNGTIERQTIFWRRAVAGDTNPLVTHAAGDTIGVRIFGFRGCVTSGDPIEAINGGSTGAAVPSASTVTATAGAITPVNPNAAIVFLLTWTNNDTSNSGTTASYSGTNPAFAEIGDNPVAAPGPGGNECDFAVAWGLKTDTTTTGSRTAVYTTASAASTNWIATLLALTPDVPAAGGTQPAAMLPLTGLQLPGQPAVSPPIGPASGSDPSAFSIITPLPLQQFIHPFLTLGLRLFPAPQPIIPVATSVTYTDSASGTITLSGTDSESHSHTSSPSGTITLSGSRTESLSASDSRSGTIALSGTSSESQSHSISTSGTVTLSGTRTESILYTDARSGTITLSGSMTQSLTGTDTGAGTITLSGTGADASTTVNPEVQDFVVHFTTSF